MNSFLDQVRRRAEQFRIRNVLIATLAGKSARAVKEALGPDYRYFAVGNPSSAHERGLVYHDGTNDETQRALEAEGIRVVLRDQGPWQAVNGGGGLPYEVGGEVPAQIWRGAHKTFRDWRFMGKMDQIINMGLKGELNALWINSQVFCRLMGDGPSVCVEITLMAADSGLLPLEEDCLAISMPNKASHAPDAAMILRPSTTAKLFTDFRIKDLLMVPREDDHWFCNKPLWPEG